MMKQTHRHLVITDSQQTEHSPQNLGEALLLRTQTFLFITSHATATFKPGKTRDRARCRSVTCRFARHALTEDSAS